MGKCTWSDPFGLYTTVSVFTTTVLTCTLLILRSPAVTEYPTISSIIFLDYFAIEFFHGTSV